MTEDEKRSLAIAAASQAAEALPQLIAFGREGPQGAHTAFDTAVVAQLCDAAKMAIDIIDDPADDELGQLKPALARFLEGWA